MNIHESCLALIQVDASFQHTLDRTCVLRIENAHETRIPMEGKKRHYSMHTSLFLYVGNFILFCKLCHYIMQIVI